MIFERADSKVERTIDLLPSRFFRSEIYSGSKNTTGHNGTSHKQNLGMLDKSSKWKTELNQILNLWQMFLGLDKIDLSSP